MAHLREGNADASPSPALPDPRAILNSIGEAVYDWDIVTNRLVFGPNTAEIPDFAEFAEIASGRAYAEHVAPDSPSSRFEAVMGSAERDCGGGVSYQVIYGLAGKAKDRAGRQKIVWIEDTGRWFAGSDDRPARAHGLVRVITDRYEAERQLARQSRYDALTGALNRAPFIEHVSALLPECIRKGGSHAILLAGIDNLAVLNEAYGYDVGDELIAATAARLRVEMRATDLMARYAGNKFALLIEGCNGEQMNAAAARFLAVVEAAPLATKAGQIAASMRIGGVVVPQQGRSAQAALHHAEEALAATRRSGGNRFVAFAPSLVRDDKRLNILHVYDEIVAALKDSRITLALQPVVSAKTREIAFHEALARVVGKDGKPVLPANIFPVAEKTGLVRLIDHRMLELVVAELASNPLRHIAINASGATVLDIQWPDRLRAACAHNNVAARLTVEITETCAIADLEATGRAIAAMQSCGVKVAMDDFGSGHTSFRNLRNLRVDLLKIDGAFIQNLARSEDDRFFVRTLVDLARHLEIPIVAEWVEDAQSAAILTDWGVDYLQDYYFGQPQAVGAVTPSAAA
ncbi:MAG TPA: bifunctional diguanylate cyclase/phosphodiesterase [Methylovirgula sp.]|nr:bifunctional diguanylate cyclase/phosphodiesterase [Methylovirgula sp.]